MLEYSWSGNIRELQNIIEYALHLTNDEQVISEENIPHKILKTDSSLRFFGKFLSIEEYTKQTILALQSEHTEEQIAEILAISRKNLWEKRKRWGLSRTL